MNSWCAQKTNNKIKEVVDNISGRIILLNALYFQGEWSSKFDKGSTTKDVFHGSEGDQTSDMMHHNYIITSFFYTDDCYGVALPFKNDKVEMIFIMPNNDEEDIFTFSKRFDDTIWSDLLASRTRKELNISLPKFKVEQRGNMTNVLNNMGLPGTMTFSKAGIYTSSPIKVQQNTYTYVDEGGAVAAAVTKVEGDTANFGSPDMSKIVFDRPFLYFIRSTETGSIIMAGRVCNL
jgi:serpin B